MHIFSINSSLKFNTVKILPSAICISSYRNVWAHATLYNRDVQTDKPKRLRSFRIMQYYV